MSTDKKPTRLEPRLRFPRFRSAAGWSVKRLGARGDFLSSLTGKSGADFDTGDAVFIPYMNVFSNTFTDLHDLRAVNVGERETQNAVARGDVFFTVSSETPEDAGMSSVLLGDIENCHLNSFCALFRFHEGRSPDPVFVGYALRSGIVRKHLARGAQGATRYNILKGVFRDVPLLLPEPAEQRKIAECLGSLDDWIAAETEALAALRRHKTGLMQQLFPRPGETRPRLRFPKFAKSKGWRAHKLGDVVAISKGKGVAKADVVEGGATPCIRYAELYTVYGEVITEIKSRTNVPVENLVLSEADDVIVPASGETKEDIATCACVMASGIALGSDLNVLRSEIDGRFFSYYLNGAKRAELAKLAQGDTVAHLYPSQISQLDINIPPDADEQHRIADCLVSLDLRIAGQTDHVAVLLRHKRGLMQQLFPAPDAADGGN